MSMPTFLFSDTPTTDIYTLSLHDALPIYNILVKFADDKESLEGYYLIDFALFKEHMPLDRKSTRLNSSHVETSYARLCLKKRIIRQLRVARELEHGGDISLVSRYFFRDIE